jgi:hypothetical protein
MQSHVRNDVTPSVDRVVTSDRLEYTDGSSIRLFAQSWVNLGCCKHRSSYPEGCVLSHPFYRVYFASEKHITRTSKIPYSRRAVNRK